MFSPQSAVTGEFCHLTGREEVRSKDGIRWRHWPVAEVRLRAAEVIYVHLNRNEFTFSNGEGENAITMQRVFYLKLRRGQNAVLDRSLDSHLVELHARRHGFNWSLDGEWPNHLFCPVPTAAVSSFSLIVRANVDDGDLVNNLDLLLLLSFGLVLS